MRLAGAIATATPVLIAVFLGLGARDYVGGLLGSVGGHWLLLAALALIALAATATTAAWRVLGGGRLGLGTLIQLVSIIFFTFPALAILLLGPALLAASARHG